MGGAFAASIKLPSVLGRASVLPQLQNAQHPLTMKTFIVLAVAIACALAADETERAKKEVLVGGYTHGAYPYAYDDGKYYPGKYEKATYIPGVPAPAAYSAGYPYAQAYGAYPYAQTYGAYPYAHSYGAYPYAQTYGAYPYAAKPVVY